MERGTYVKVARNNVKFWVIFDSLYKTDYFFGIVDNDIKGHYKLGDKALFKTSEAILISSHKHYKYRLKDTIDQMQLKRTQNKMILKSPI